MNIIKLLCFVFLFNSPLMYSQVNTDMDGDVAKLIGDIVLNYKDSEVKQIKIRHSEKFGSQVPIKGDFHYTFLNDSIVSHYSSWSFLIWPILGGSLGTNQNWFYDKNETVKYIIRNGEFYYVPEPADSIFHDPLRFERDTNDLHQKKEYYYQIRNNDTILTYSVISKYDDQNRLVSEYRKDYERSWEWITENQYVGNTEIRKEFFIKNGKKSLDVHTSVLTENKDSLTIITETDLIPYKEEETNITVTTIYYDPQKRIEKISRIITIVFKEEEHCDTSIEKHILDVKVLK